MDCSCHAHNGFLTRRGYAKAEVDLREGVDRAGVDEYLDRVLSVSGPTVDRRDLTFDDRQVILNDQYLLQFLASGGEA